MSFALLSLLVVVDVITMTTLANNFTGESGVMNFMAPSRMHRRDETGEGTFYDPGLGACEVSNKASDLIAALNQVDFGTFPRALNSPACFSCINVCASKGCVTVQVTDKCPGCKKGDIDLSPTAFNKIDDPIRGRIPITWSYIDCSTGKKLNGPKSDTDYPEGTKISPPTPPPASPQAPPQNLPQPPTKPVIKQTTIPQKQPPPVFPPKRLMVPIYISPPSKPRTPTSSYSTTQCSMTYYPTPTLKNIPTLAVGLPVLSSSADNKEQGQNNDGSLVSNSNPNLAEQDSFRLNSSAGLNPFFKETLLALTTVLLGCFLI